MASGLPKSGSQALEAGLKALEVAPSGRAKCYVCSKTIAKGSWRFDYRIKSSSSLSDGRRIHVECAGGLPEATRAVDARALQAFCKAPDLGETQRGLLEAALAALAPNLAESSVAEV